jgi:hypothetical protein
MRRGATKRPASFSDGLSPDDSGVVARPEPSRTSSAMMRRRAWSRSPTVGLLVALGVAVLDDLANDDTPSGPRDEVEVIELERDRTLEDRGAQLPAVEAAQHDR